MKPTNAWVAISLLSPSLVFAQPSFTVRFDRPQYDIAPGEVFPVKLLIDPIPPTGLHSFGVRLKFDSTHASVGDASAVIPAPPLDFDGVRGPGAMKAVGSGYAAVKGTVDGSVQPPVFYTQEILATFPVADLAPGPYTLKAEFFNTLGPTEQIFVDGLGSVLDSQIAFGEAVVNYRPSVTLTDPPPNAAFQLPTIIPLGADALDLDGTIAKVEFYDGDSKIGEAGSPPFAASWSTASPGMHSIRAVATDDLGAQGNSITVEIEVRPPNSPPKLGELADVTVDELAVLTLTASASDSDVPAQVLIFSLGAGAPAGASIQPDTGELTWTPTEAQGPGAYPVTVIVTDNGSPPLSASQTLTITVREVNQPPVLDALSDLSVDEGTLLTFTATAQDADRPAQKLTFSLDPSAPSGAGIDAGSGLFTWNPTPAQAGKVHSLTIRVTDDGTPPLSDSKTFHIAVTAKPSAYAIFAGKADLPVGSKVLNWNGSANQASGRIHSNSDIDVSGNKHVFRHGDVEYVTGIHPNSGLGDKLLLDDARLVQSTVQPYPLDYQLSQFDFGGALAAEAAAAGKYFHLKGSSNLKEYIVNSVLKEGLYFVEGKVQLTGHGLSGNVTIVATDEINLSASDAMFTPYSRCLLAFSGKKTAGYSKSAVSLSGSGNKWRGILFAPEGGVEISGAANSALVGSLVGLGVTVTGQGFQLVGVDLQSCEPAKIRPASLAACRT